jgi:hypothetical protein
MGQFKPMVKMMTNEPSVILKLKKGGKVHHKEHHEEHGHKSMHHASSGMMEGAHEAFEAEHGNAPKKPSMAARRKAMNPNQYAKGGKVAHKGMGGEMRIAPDGTKYSYSKEGAPTTPIATMLGKISGNNMIAPMARPAIAKMDPAARMARAAMVRKALTGMKKGGSTMDCAALEKELKHHESMSASKAHPQHKASGGAIDRAETRTTIESGAKKFEKTKMVDGDHHDKHHGTGQIKEGRAGGYATGGAIPADTRESKNKAKTKMGGTYEGNEHDYVETEMHTAKRDRAHGTGGIKETNAGGFKRGGKVPGIGRAIEHDGDWENRPADTAHAGKQNGTTGGVRESNAGGFKRGGAAKKHFATGGNVVDDGKAEKMPHHFVSRPVANSLQSGTFKKGGKVKKFEDGGSSGDPIIDRENRRMKAEKEAERAANESMRGSIINAPRNAFNAIKGMFESSPKPAGSVTKTEKSVTVAPGKKRGGSARY